MYIICRTCGHTEGSAKKGSKTTNKTTGIERTKMIARSFVYWPHIDNEIETLVQNCDNCALAAKMPIKSTLQPWPVPSSAWERLHIDYAGPIDSKYYLIIIDAYSKWPEIIETSTISSNKTVEILNEVISRFGIPKVILSDNGTQFTSNHFENFTAENGITHIRSSPYYPMSNGQAERFVDSFKRALRKLNGEGTTSQNLQTFLQTYRSTPNKNTPSNVSPAEALFGRNIRTTLNLLKPQPVPDPISQISKAYMQKQFNEKHGAKARSFVVNDKVYISIHKDNGFIWQPATIRKRLGKVLYEVLLEDKKSTRAHVNQLRKRYSETTSETPTLLTEAFGIFDSACNNDDSEIQETIPIQGHQAEKQDHVIENQISLQTPPELDKNLSQQFLRRTHRTRKPVDRFVPG